MKTDQQSRMIRKQQQDRAARRELVAKLETRHAERGQFDVQTTDERDVLLVPSELLAEESAVTNPAVQAQIADAGFTIEPVDCLRGRVVRLTQAGATRETVDDFRAALEASGVSTSLAYVTPNKVIIKAEATPEQAEHHPEPRKPAAAAGGTAVRVAVLDTGIALCGRTDGWLAGLQNPANTDPLDEFPTANGKLDFAAGHGTFIAGLYQLADTDLDLRIRRVLDSDGLVGEVDVACALVTCVDEELADGGKLVVNLSLGTDTLDDKPPLALQVALDIVREIEAERSGDLLLVAAAGNDGLDKPCWPAAFAAGDDKVVAVAALGKDDAPADWSTHGSWVTCSTRGDEVLSTFVTGTEDPTIDSNPETFGKDAWATWTGTSFAAPQVAARIASIARASGVDLTTARDTLFTDTSLGNHPMYGELLGFS